MKREREESMNEEKRQINSILNIEILIQKLLQNKFVYSSFSYLDDDDDGGGVCVQCVCVCVVDGWWFVS